MEMQSGKAILMLYMITMLKKQDATFQEELNRHAMKINDIKILSVIEALRPIM